MTYLLHLLQNVEKTIDVIRNTKDSNELQYAVSGVGGDRGCAIQLIADFSCSTVEQLIKWDEDDVFNSLKVRLRPYRTVSSAIAICKAAKSSGWSLIIGADENCPDTLDTFLADFAVGVGASQLAPGSMDSGEGCSKLNRLLEISRENDNSISFVGRSFRT